MTYPMLTLFFIAAGVWAVVMLFRREMPPADMLRVAWGNPTPPEKPPTHRHKLVFRGPDRFCPTCGRWLVRIKPDGTFDLAAQAGIDSIGEVEYEDGVPISDEMEVIVTDAYCLFCEPDR